MAQTDALNMVSVMERERAHLLVGVKDKVDVYPKWMPVLVERMRLSMALVQTDAQSMLNVMEREHVHLLDGVKDKVVVNQNQ